ncbi:MAG: Ig-like domain-containing protein [Bacteroidales bacterium]|nr:Ig-like domain-containing protein [Bacteroidales bacterium]
MKKLFYYVLAITVAAIAAVSCNKGEEDHIVKEDTSFCYTFTIADDITKATLDGQGVQWVDGDKVGMYIVESDGQTEVHTGFANVDVTTSPKTIKLYSKKAIPAGAIAYTYFPQHSNENKTATVIRFDAEQQGGGKSVMPMVGLPFTVETAVSLSGNSAQTNGEIHFLNLGAIIDFKVFGENFNTETIQSIKFKATGKKVNNEAVNPVSVCGHATLDVTQINLQNSSCLDLAFNDAEHVSDSAVVMQQVPVAAGSDDATSIYMVVAPGSYSGAITIETDAAYYTFPFDYTKGISLSRNTVKHISIDLANCTSRVEKPQSFTWDLSIDQTVSASTLELAWNYRGVTMVAAKADASTNANNYYPGTTGKTYTSTRFYTSSTLTITPYTGSSIAYVEFLATQNSYATALKDSEWTNATTSAVSNNEKLIKVTPTNGANAFYATIGATCGFTSVTVYYTGELGEEQGGPVEANIYFNPDSKEVSWDEIDNFEKPAMVKPEDFDGTFTWSSSNEDVATVDNNGDITFVGNGTTTITASYSLTAKYLSGSASYVLTVTGKPAEKGESGENPYTVADALTVIDALDDGETTADTVYVQGVISEVISYSYNKITYNIIDEGTSVSSFIQVYNGKGLNGADFTSINDLGVGDEVIVKGILQKYVKNNVVTPEFSSGSKLFSLNRAPYFNAVLSQDAFDYTGGTATLTISTNVSWTASIDNGAALTYGPDTASSASGTTDAEITVIIPEDEEGNTYTLSFITDPDLSPESFTITQTPAGTYPKGSEQNPYTASEAATLALNGNTGTYYISGYVSKVQNQYSASYGTANMWLSDNEDDALTFEGYHIKYFNDIDWVTGNGEIAVGDLVIIYGTLTVFNNTTPETTSGYLVSLNGKTKGLTPGSLTATPDNANKQITVTWGAATGTDSTISYVVTCGTQSYNADAAGSHTFTMSDYGLYSISVIASASDAISATISTNATLSNPSITTKDYYKLITNVNDITAGTYVVGALRSSSATNNFYFGKASVSSGDWVVSDNYVTVAQDNNGVRRFEIASLPDGAVEFTFSGDNTNGFTISNGTKYLYYTEASSRKLSFDAKGSSQKWTVVAKSSPLISGGVCFSAVGTQPYTISENSTATGAIRGYANNTQYRAIYLFKKVNE